MKHIFKSIGAVLAGFVSVAVLSIATDVVLESLTIFPPQTKPEEYTTWMLAMALAYRSVYTVIGGYVTAKLAPSHYKKHVVALMILGGIGGVLGAVTGWDLGNHWYPVALAATGPLLVWLGGSAYKA
jgi:hypothetical protein